MPGPCPDGRWVSPKLKAKYPTLWTGPELSEAEGCEFNTRLTGGYENAGHPDGSYGTHNPFLYRALLTSCISYLQAKYPPDLPAPPAQVQEILDRFSAPAPAGTIVRRDAGR